MEILKAMYSFAMGLPASPIPPKPVIPWGEMHKTTRSKIKMFFCDYQLSLVIP
jgi:hypothetical protein